METARMGRVARVRAYPSGRFRPQDLELVSEPVPAPRDGEVLVRTICFAVDPALRLRLSANPPPGYLDPIPLGAIPPAFTLGVVEQSGTDGFAAGDLVTHGSGWREWAIVTAGGASDVPVGGLQRLEPADGVAAHHYLGVLGVTGLTAYAGLLDVAELRSGDVVWVSAAAGAVGSIAVQIAALRGHTVIGSAGAPEKVRLLREELGIAAFSHRDGDLAAQLRRAAPVGVDVYFDNVGGDHFAAALSVLRPFGRIAACGAIAGYERDVSAPDGAPGVSAMQLFNIVVNRITVRGLRVADHLARMTDLRRELEPAVASGRLRTLETTVSGLSAAPQALADLLSGATSGRVLISC